MAMLRTLGIEPGSSFAPDERQAKLLAEGTVVGEAMAKATSLTRVSRVCATARTRTGTTCSSSILARICR